MNKKIYLSAIEQKRGKSFVSTALVASLLHIQPNSRIFKLFEEKDVDQKELLEAIVKHPLPSMMDIDKAISRFRTEPGDLLAEILNFISEQPLSEVAFFEGSDFQSDNDMTEFQFNLSIAQQLNCEVLLVIDAKNRSFEHVETLIKSALAMAKKNHTFILGIIINQVAPNSEGLAKQHFEALFPDLDMCIVLPEFEHLAYPTMGDIARVLGADTLLGEQEMDRQVKQYTIAAKTISNFLPTRATKKDALIITPDDRMDILLGSMLADQSTNHPKIAGIVLTGGQAPSEYIQMILKGIAHPFPVLLCNKRTYETVTFLNEARYSLNKQQMSKVQSCIDTLLPYFVPPLAHVLKQKMSKLSVTPAIFLNDLLLRAKSKVQHIVLPEGHDPRILKAADYLLQRGVIRCSILGNSHKIHKHCKRFGLQLKGANLIDVDNHPDKNQYSEVYYQLRKHKNINQAIAHERLSDVNYFGAMMVYSGDADGMVSGAIHTTADTVRPALEIIKTKPGVHRVSSIFIMCLPSRVLIYGDCAINPEPDSETLAEIAAQAAMMSERLGIEPRVALLSYSSGDSGQGASVKKVQEAMAILHTQHPHLLAEGPMQYDAAVDSSVAQKKLPQSNIAGRASVLIFPDLNTGNNTYKAVQRETGALAIGPVLLGLNKPVNDLSRGCTVQDVINTILITAIQAQEHSL